MPNWCENKVIIKGLKKDINALKQLMKEDENDTEYKFMMSKILPPTEIFERKYNWCMEHWGLGQDVYEADEFRYNHYHENEIFYYFWTAWYPALEIWKFITRKFPGLSVEVRYYEPGMEHYGCQMFELGEVVKKIEYSPDDDIEEFFTFVEENFEYPEDMPIRERYVDYLDPPDPHPDY